MVDALVSGTSVSDDVKVRVLSWAPRRSGDENRRSFFFYSACKSLEFMLLSCHAHGAKRPVGPESDPHSYLGMLKWLIQEIKGDNPQIDS